MAISQGKISLESAEQTDREKGDIVVVIPGWYKLAINYLKAGCREMQGNSGQCFVDMLVFIQGNVCRNIKTLDWDMDRVEQKYR